MVHSRDVRNDTTVTLRLAKRLIASIPRYLSVFFSIFLSYTIVTKLKDGFLMTNCLDVYTGAQYQECDELFGLSALSFLAVFPLTTYLSVPSYVSLFASLSAIYNFILSRRISNLWKKRDRANEKLKKTGAEVELDKIGRIRSSSSADVLNPRLREYV